MDEDFRQKCFHHYIKTNWKSILCMIIAMVVICYKDLFGGIFTLFFCLYYVHQFHYLSHLDFVKPIAILHIVHHETNSWWGHLLEILYEFIVMTTPLFGKIFMDFAGIPFPVFNISFLAFFYMFYTTHHNINYSYFHVNRIHERHHKHMTKNLGLDICDNYYGTKCVLPNDTINDIVENTDHYIPNIIIFLAIVLISNWYIKKYNIPNREYFLIIFCVLYIIFIILSFSMLLFKTMSSEKKQEIIYKDRIKDLLGIK